MTEILIKGLALPKPSTYPITLSIYPNGNIYINHELSDYKAIEVPPHGDLIDRNEFFENDKGKSVIVSCNAEFHAVSELYEKIRNAKTVIEASI